MSDEGNTDATVDEAKVLCCGRRKAGQRRHGDSEVGMAGSESSHPVRNVREHGSMAAWHGGVEGWAKAGGSFSSLVPCSASGVNPTSSPLPIPFRPPQTSTTLCACHLSRCPRPRLACQARSYSLLRAPPTYRPRYLCHVCPRVPPNGVETTPQQALESQPAATVPGCQGARPLPQARARYSENLECVAPRHLRWFG
jgi:hypothetical protein